MIFEPPVSIMYQALDLALVAVRSFFTPVKSRSVKLVIKYSFISGQKRKFEAFSLRETTQGKFHIKFQDLDHF